MAIAKRLRELEIDIAVDRRATGSARPGSRAASAPSAHYLGYPGTMGASYIDCRLPAIVIPDGERKFEQIAYLPDSYQCNDRKRPLRATPNRAAGLPNGSCSAASMQSPDHADIRRLDAPA
jgi:predicted O-linked N-acetylglucosamine transferase (SPINDLY family)